MEILIPGSRAWPLHRRLRHHVGVAGSTGRVGGFDVKGIDVARAPALETSK